MPPSSIPALPPEVSAQQEDESATETRVMQPVSAPDQDSDQDSEGQHSPDRGSSEQSQYEDTMEIDGDATVMVPASQLPAGTQHLSDPGSPKS
jgi:hypothetical protein